MMSKYTKLVSRAGALLVVAGTVLAGCTIPVGDAALVGDRGARSTGLVEVHSGIEPLGSVSSDAWQDAPPDCHGRLPIDVRFELVREGLVVALDVAGNPLCVDTIDNVQRELQGSGRVSEASDLEDAYLLAVGLAIPNDDISAGDPTPQPSSEGMNASPADPTDTGEIDKGDPTPQPSTQPMDPDEA